MRTKSLLISTAIGALLAITPVTVQAVAQAQTEIAPASVELMAAKKKSKAVRRGYRGQQRIACTVAGCHPVPPGCMPTVGFNRWGDPAGFDVVVCRR